MNGESPFLGELENGGCGELLGEGPDVRRCRGIVKRARGGNRETVRSVENDRVADRGEHFARKARGGCATQVRRRAFAAEAPRKLGLCYRILRSNRNSSRRCHDRSTRHTGGRRDN